MRCLYCGKPLPWHRKLAGKEEFCSDAHREKYHEEYNRLALSRLLQANPQDEKKAGRKTAAEPKHAPEPVTAPEPASLSHPAPEPEERVETTPLERHIEVERPTEPEKTRRRAPAAAAAAPAASQEPEIVARGNLAEFEKCSFAPAGHKPEAPEIAVAPLEIAVADIAQPEVGATVGAAPKSAGYIITLPQPKRLAASIQEHPAENEPIAVGISLPAPKRQEPRAGVFGEADAVALSWDIRAHAAREQDLRFRGDPIEFHSMAPGKPGTPNAAPRNTFPKYSEMAVSAEAVAPEVAPVVDPYRLAPFGYLGRLRPAFDAGLVLATPDGEDHATVEPDGPEEGEFAEELARMQSAIESEHCAEPATVQASVAEGPHAEEYREIAVAESPVQFSTIAIGFGFEDAPLQTRPRLLRDETLPLRPKIGFGSGPRPATENGGTGRPSSMSHSMLHLDGRDDNRPQEGGKLLGKLGGLLGRRNRE